MANFALAQHANTEQQRISVAVRPCRHDLQTITRCFSFGPKAFSRAAKERDEPGALCCLQALRGS